jgi:acetyl-CoA carboxylase biotin carboxyl carrier protein
MALLGYDLDELARLLAMMDASGLDEIILEEEDRSLKLRGPRRAKLTIDLPAAPVPAAQGATMLTLPPAKSAAKSHTAPSGNVATEPTEGQVALTAPMVGVFYRAEKPGAAPFVSVGQHVSVGQTVGVIEAMKVFSEIPAEHAGVVVSIPAQDGHLVQAGSPLFILQQE